MSYARGNRNVILERLEGEALRISRSRGVLTVDDIYVALEAHDIEEAFAIFIRAPRFTGWNAVDDEPLSVVLRSLNLKLSNTCPCCSAAWEAQRNDMYNTAYQDGYNAGLEARP